MVHLFRATLLTFVLAGAALAGEVDGILTGGGSAFLDGPVHGVVGGSLRFYVNERLAFEPEYLYMRGSKFDQDHVGLANLLYHFNDSNAPVSPFVIGGVGVFNHRDRTFSTSDAEAMLGGGARINFTDRVFLEPRVRLGVQDVNVSFTASLGFVLGDR